MLNIDLFPWLWRLSEGWANLYERRRRRQTLNFLQTVAPEKLEFLGQALALKKFRQAAAQVEFYKDLLRDLAIKPADIKTIQDFQRLPILDKSIFQENKITQLTSDGSLRKVKTVLTSSGFSGIFSFGLNLGKNLQNTARLIDLGLDFIFDISSQKTLIINCLPMGVKVYTNTCILAEVSVREDMALAVIKKFHPHFEQILIIGEAFFLKHLIETGLSQQIDWARMNIGLIAGEDSLPENYRTYIASLLGINLEQWPPKVFMSSLGIAELDLNLFHETPDTVRLRRLAHTDLEFRRALFGKELSYCPMLFQYYPHRTYLEEVNNGQLVITQVSSVLKIPLIRYNTGDQGGLISYNKLADILNSRNQGHLQPRLRLPLVFVEGRALSEQNKIQPEVVREILFADHAIAKEITGFFKIRKKENNEVIIAIQLKDGSNWKTDYNDFIKYECQKYFSLDIKVQPIEYYDFKEALVLNYNKKFKHY